MLSNLYLNEVDKMLERTKHDWLLKAADKRLREDVVGWRRNHVMF